MISKTILATHPRHRPLLEVITAGGWREVRAGQWISDSLAVCLEIDGLWHSYATATETRKKSPGFVAVSDAMRDAMRRGGGMAAA